MPNVTSASPKLWFVLVWFEMQNTALKSCIRLIFMWENNLLRQNHKVGLKSEEQPIRINWDDADQVCFLKHVGIDAAEHYIRDKSDLHINGKKSPINCLCVNSGKCGKCMFHLKEVGLTSISTLWSYLVENITDTTGLWCFYCSHLTTLFGADVQTVLIQHLDPSMCDVASPARNVCFIPRN